MVLITGYDEAAVRCGSGQPDAAIVWDEKSWERNESGAFYREAYGQDGSTARRLYDDLHGQRQSRSKIQGIFICILINICIYIKHFLLELFSEVF